MVKRLRRRPRSDSHVNDIRPRSGRLGRWVYLGLVVALFAGLANYAVGDRFEMRAEGMVVRDRTAIAPTSVVRVETVHVRPGQMVRAGQLLLQVGSAEILDGIAEQSARTAQLVQREAALRARSELADAMLPLAEDQATRAKDMLAQLETGMKRGLVNAPRLESAMGLNYAAQAEVIRLRTDRETLVAELATISTARKRAEASLDRLRAHYAQGEIRAPEHGTIGPDVPSDGAVYRAGEPMLAVFRGRSYALAYLPSSYMFSISDGMEVEVSDGRRRSVARIVEILPVSQAVPNELRATFRPQDRRQLARVEFDGDVPFPTLAAVRVTRSPHIVNEGRRISAAWSQWAFAVLDRIRTPPSPAAPRDTRPPISHGLPLAAR